MNTRPSSTILLVEDNDDHADMMASVLERISGDITLERVADGEAALLRLQGPQSRELPLPNLLLLDIKLPKLNGLEVLERIKADPALVRLPVVMLTTSNSDRDRRAAEERHANAFLVKPMSFEELQGMLAATTKFWLEHVSARDPRRGEPANRSG